MRQPLLWMLLIANLAGAAASAATSPGNIRATSAAIDRGRYLVQIAGCNDCHTPGYAASGGKVDEQLWLTGETVGWSGPWGTTYATNLRIFLKDMDEQTWLKYARTFTARPPMPWFNVRAMSDDDLRSAFAYIKSLPVTGKPAPAYVPPGRKGEGLVIQFP